MCLFVQIITVLQLNIANKRAVDAERRLEDAVEKESEMKSELTRLELNLRLKIDKKKALIHELAEQKSDLEKVSKELYDELQNALLVSERFEADNEAMKDLLDEYRAGDASVAVVREKLEIEYERARTLEDKIEDLQKDLNTVEHAYREVVKVNERLELEAMEMKEEMAGMQYELNRQRNRTDVLTHDNLAMEEVSRNLKHHIVKLNDHIVEIKGSIRVFCRVRPLFVDEINGLHISEADLESLIRYPDYNILDFNSCPFEFDRVFEPCIGQEDVYDEVDPYVRSVMNGCRACIFA
jgi:chromosome segregation ATPase